MEDRTKKILLYSLGTFVLIGVSYYLYNEYKTIKAGVTAENKQNKVVINKI
jgi:hypothetical protein